MKKILSNKLINDIRIFILLLFICNECKTHVLNFDSNDSDVYFLNSTLCPPGYYLSKPLNSSENKSHKNNRFTLSNNTHLCIKCPVNTTLSENRSLCILCKDGYDTKGLEGMLTCTRSINRDENYKKCLKVCLSEEQSFNVKELDNNEITLKPSSITTDGNNVLYFIIVFSSVIYFILILFSIISIARNFIMALSNRESKIKNSNDTLNVNSRYPNVFGILNINKTKII